MSNTIKLTIEILSEDGIIVKKEVAYSKLFDSPSSINELGFRHKDQIDILQSVQDILIYQQIDMINQQIVGCNKCGTQMSKKGYNKSNFHAVFTDHKVPCSRKVCSKCKNKSIPSVKSIFGTHIHPDLAKLQLEASSNYTYREAQEHLNSMVCGKRTANNHTGLKALTESAGMYMDANQEPLIKDIAFSSELIVEADGGHLKTTEDQRSIEAMASVVYNPHNIQQVGGKTKKDGSTSHKRAIITNKSCRSSALSDAQESIKRQTLQAAIEQGLTEDTSVTALCDGASNCWSIIDVFENKCSNILRILDWFHIAMRFKNSGLGKDDLNEKLDGAKWFLWHGDAPSCLDRLSEIKVLISNNQKSLNKVDKLYTYIDNNKDFIVNYDLRKKQGLVVGSGLIESTVGNLINTRCKGSKRMRWSRKGAHAVLVVRAGINDKKWNNSWEEQVNNILKHAV